MKGSLPIAAALFCVVACAATPEWGQPVDGLTLSVSLETDSHGGVQTRIAVRYDGENPLLLPFAFITGDEVSRYRLKLFVSGTGGDHTFSLDDPTKPIRGRFDPLVIPMVPYASYVVTFPLAAWCKGCRSPSALEALIGSGGELWVELDCKYLQSTAIPPLACPLYGYPNPNAITCWQGKLVSNRMRLPR